MSLPTTMPCCSCSSRAWRSRASNSSVSAREGVHSVAFVDHTYRYTRHESLGFQQAESLDTPQSHEPEIGSGGRQARLGILGLQRLPSERLLCSQRELGTDAPMARGRAYPQAKLLADVRDAFVEWVLQDGIQRTASNVLHGLVQWRDHELVVSVCTLEEIQQCAGIAARELPHPR